MKKLLQFLILFIPISLLWYMIFSFIIWNINISEWSKEIRLLFGLGEFFIFFVTLLDHQVNSKK
jgi:hypothetical protein